MLGVDYDQCFVSDESSLWDFHEQDSNDELYRRIVLLYAVDVSDIEEAKLWRIFERLWTKSAP